MGEGGRIINFSSVSARQATPSSTVYAASKAAVEAITRVMGVSPTIAIPIMTTYLLLGCQIELRDKGIRVNAVNPGPTTTDMFYNMPAENQEFVKTQGPVADPSDIADIVVFLAGNQSRWITASTVNSNNGTVLFQFIPEWYTEVGSTS